MAATKHKFGLQYVRLPLLFAMGSCSCAFQFCGDADRDKARFPRADENVALLSPFTPQLHDFRDSSALSVDGVICPFPFRGMV